MPLTARKNFKEHFTQKFCNEPGKAEPHPPEIFNR